MEHVIFASYGNDSIALIQWAHERRLSGVHVAYSDTGWAAEWWLARVEVAEAWAQGLGFTTHRIASEGMEALVKR
jgi:aryl carrier-like protein